MVTISMAKQSGTVILMLAGIFLAYQGVTIEFLGVQLWKLLLGIGLTLFLIYNGLNLTRIILSFFG